MKSLYFAPLLLLALSCTSNPRDSEDNKPLSEISDKNTAPVFTTDTLYKDLKNPWGMVWLPDGRILVTERAGEILVFKNDRYTGQKLSGVPRVYQSGQGGLFDIQLHPDYKKNGYIYIAYAKPGPGGGSTAVMRAKLRENTLTEHKQIYITNPLSNSGVHFGGRIVFDKRGYLYFSSGERGTKPNAQNLDNDLGKIHRLYDDGRIPADNPFPGKAGAKSSVWSYGHRNPQGMVYDAENDRIWTHEHGAKGGDELNLIEKGANYGWPLTTYGVDYNGSKISDLQEKEGVTNPVHYWVPSIAPCGMVLVTSDRYSGWKGNLLIGALAKTHVARIQLKGKTFSGEEKLLENIGRVRYVAQSPDGYIYVLTEGRGMLLKLLPLKKV